MQGQVTKKKVSIRWKKIPCKLKIPSPHHFSYEAPLGADNLIFEKGGGGRAGWKVFLSNKFSAAP